MKPKQPNSTNKKQTDETLLTYSDLADILKVSESKLRHDVMNRSIPHIKVAGRSVRFSPSAIKLWLNSQSVEVKQ